MSLLWVDDSLESEPLRNPQRHHGHRRRRAHVGARTTRTPSPPFRSPGRSSSASSMACRTRSGERSSATTPRGCMGSRSG